MKRSEGLAVLARARPDEVIAAWASCPAKPDYAVLRGPETGLVMIRGRMGGGGDPFNLGEATVTRASVKLETGEIGHAYRLGRDRESTLYAAVLDALWQREERRDGIERDVLAPLDAATAAHDRQVREEAAATRVDFFTMVRGEDA